MLLVLGALASRPATAQPTAFQILNLQASADTVGRYEKFELTFDITGTVATNPYFPYDPNPPPGVPAGVGITVDGLFSPDNWTTVITQPAFLYQNYQRQCIGDTPENDCRKGNEWLYPVGAPVWKVRFAPQQTGIWRYRIHATDASGTTQSGEGTFTVTLSTDPLNHGFIRISPNDPGYFEYSDGTPFIGVGHNAGFEDHRFTYSVDEEMRRFAANRVNFLRIWMTGDSIYMASWHPWDSHHLPYEGGYFNAASLTYTVHYSNHLFSLRLWDYNDPGVSNRRNPCMFQGFSNNVAIKPNTTYLLHVRLQTVGVTGPRNPSYPYGFTVRKGGWLGKSCSDPAAISGNSVRLSGYVTGTTPWHEITSTFTTGPDESFLDNFYLILENTTGGDVFIDEVSLREVSGSVPIGPEVLRKNRFAYQQYFDQQPSWQWDYAFERAAQGGVTIRPVVLEKNDWIANHIDENGNPIGGYYDLDNNRFYAAPDRAVRRYHEYFWRYLIARWGYSRGVHSWELMNEGDPYNGNHYAMADAFGRFMKTHDPNRHLVTTSNWYSFPTYEFWGNPAYANVDYADIHAYACCGQRYAGWAQTIGDPLSFEDRPAYVYGNRGHSVRVPGATRFYNAGGTPRFLTIRGAGEWIIRYVMKAANFTGTCGYGIPNTFAGPRLMWILDGTTSNVVPPTGSGQDFICSAPAGTYDWRLFDSQHTYTGAEAPLSTRIVITDNAIHSLRIYFQNRFGNGGDAWIDNIELIAPDGQRIYLNGEFDLTRLYDDSALLSAGYSLMLGGRTASGPGKPVTRGEVAIGDDDDYRGDRVYRQTLDVQGIWLHNFLWAQINPGGLYELYWDPYNIRRHNLYYHFKAFRDFMDGLPLSNGHYEDARAVTSHPDLRVWGQADRVAYRGHLWVQNRHHTWRNVVDGVPITPIAGSITIPGLISGTYRITWWDTIRGSPFLTQTVPTASDELSLALPEPLATDVACKFESISDNMHAVHLPIVFGGGESGPTPTATSTPTETPRPTPTPTATPTGTGVLSSEWSQHAHDAQHTGYAPQAPPYPWRWRWIWNGVDAAGGVRKVTTGGSLPRNVQPVTGGGRVYIAAGSDGIFALSEATGQPLWQRSGIGDVRSTVAYDHNTQSVFVVSADGRLYKLRATDGTVVDQFDTGQTSTLPLPPAVLGDRVLFAMDNAVYAVNKQTMQPIWTYNAGATVAVPPAYSPSRDLVIVATEPDLYVHAIRNANGTQAWRVRPVHSSRNFTDPTEYRLGWPVIADGAGYVLIKVRLDWGRLWREWPQTNAAMRQLLTDNPGDQALFVLDLDDGSVPYIANVGHGGYGDNDYLPMGPQPVVKRLANGREVVYIIIRARHGVPDGRWDSHFGEMVLDSATVSGLQGGDVRFIRFDWPPGDANPYLLTDEQPNVTAAGNYLFGAHWEAGFAMRILDRSDTLGSFTDPITTQRLSTVATSQDDTGACAFSASHYCAGGLFNTRPYDFGFYIYYNQGTVYDRYWSEYATWVVSNDNLYFRSTDGAIVALTSGDPQMAMAMAAPPAVPTPSLRPQGGPPKATIPHTEARAWAGHTVTVTGTLRYVFNNGKQVLLGFANPHQGAFKAIIRQEHWDQFEGAPEKWYAVDRRVAIVGTIGWYQGDPTIYVTTPEQIQVLPQKGGRNGR